MSETCQEQRPLLCDDYLEEDFCVENYSFQRRTRPSFCSGRALNHAKGAAAVIARWPDNCSTSVAYWWLGVIMITLTVFVIYNFVLILGMVPRPNVKPPEYRFFNNVIKPQKQPALSHVFMHLVVNNNTDLDVSKHLPHIEDLSLKYPNYKYTVLVLVNDTLQDALDFGDDKRNKIAFDSLWTYNGPKKRRYQEHNVSVEYVSLTTYLNESPIKKLWRNLPSHIIEFLVRTVSIWEKGGISFNSIILPNENPNPKYIEKLYSILEKYEKLPNILKPTSPSETQTVNKKRPNNIQDIINALSNEDNILENDLNVADNNDVNTVLDNKVYLRNRRHATQKDYNVSGTTQTTFDDEVEKKENYTRDSMHPLKTDKKTISLFLKHLLHVNPNNDFETNTSNLNNSKLLKHTQRPIEVKRNTAGNFKLIDSIESKEIISPELSIDIEGNIIASKKACHAFLGTMYSNAYRHTEEKTVADFILAELSDFCDGPFSSCKGIDVILV